MPNPFFHHERTTEEESRQKQLEFYKSWVNSAKTRIAQTLERFSALAKEFSVERNVAFLILDDYGAGGAEVCRFIGDQVIWLSDRVQKQDEP